MAVDGELARNLGGTYSGLLILQSLHLVGLLAGGALAGAGKRQGIVYGALVGLANGHISVGQQYASNRLRTPELLYAQPALHTLLAAVGGFLGLLIWRPLTPATIVLQSGPLKPVVRDKDNTWFGGPIAWFRVLAGIGLALGGALWASAILDIILEAGKDHLTLESNLQAQLVTFEITVLALLAGGVWAGATTGNGVKQGLFVGLATAAVLAGVRLTGKHIHLDTVVTTISSALIFSLVGGWFGSQLFPPLGGYMRRKHLGGAAV
jgi:hypothetical protein